MAVAAAAVSVAALAGCASTGGAKHQTAATEKTVPPTAETTTTEATSTEPSTTSRPATTKAPTTVPPTTTAAPPTTAAPQPSADANHPNPALSPGAVFAGVTRQQVCTVGFSSSVRNVPQSLKDQVFAEYGITNPPAGAYEVDHLISLELGGSNDIKNLWPEPYSGPDSARRKDTVENLLHREVCSGVITLAAAQADVLHWERFSQPGPSGPVPPPATTAPPPGPVGVYYKNCAAARAAGAAPIHRGQPGYRPALDRDGDGVACE